MLTKEQFDQANPKAITSPDVFQLGETYWLRHQSTVTPVVFNGFTVENGVLQFNLTSRDEFRGKRFLSDMGVVAYHENAFDGRAWNAMNSTFECQYDAMRAIHGPLPDVSDEVWATAHLMNYLISNGHKEVVDTALRLEAMLMGGGGSEEFINIFGDEDYDFPDEDNFFDEDGIGDADDEGDFELQVVVIVIQ